MAAAETPQHSYRRNRRRPLVVVIAITAAIALVAGLAVGGWAWWTRPVGEPEAVAVGAAELGPQLSGATVLGLGEATHGNAEFQRLRLLVLDRLPHFRAVVLEEDFGTVARANAYVQGGPGSAVAAAGQFGFAINRTAEMAEFLRQVRARNTTLPAGERIELVGMDVQRYAASRELALTGLRAVDPQLADRLARRLAGLTDDAPPEHPAALLPAVDRLRTALSTADGADLDTARNAALALRQGISLDAAPAGDYAERRAEIMFANLRRTVAEQAGRGNRHTLLFGHNGHLDKVSTAFPHADLGERAVREWGAGYRVIGTEFVHSTFISGARENRWQVTMVHRTPLRGMFDGVPMGLLSFADAGRQNRALLARPVRMASAGESFRRWQALVPPLNSVSMIPLDSYDALILVHRATPVTPL